MDDQQLLAGHHHEMALGVVLFGKLLGFAFAVCQRLEVALGDASRRDERGPQPILEGVGIPHH
jgi:hypothetical protein